MFTRMKSKHLNTWISPPEKASMEHKRGSDVFTLMAILLSKIMRKPFAG